MARGNEYEFGRDGMLRAYDIEQGECREVQTMPRIVSLALGFRGATQSGLVNVFGEVLGSP